MEKTTFSVGLLWFFCILSLCQSYPTFDEYLHDFQKNYTSQEETIKRKQIYEARIAKFATITQFTPGVNNLTDWTDEEIKSLKNYAPQKQFEMQNQQGSQNVQVQSQYISVGSPQQLDWRNSRAVTSVKNQGDCGSCWAFAVVAYVESKLIIQKGYSLATDLSEQFLVSCTAGSTCNGGYLQNSLRVVSNKGLPYQESFPYNPFSEQDPDICYTNNTVKDMGNKPKWQYNVSDARLIQLLQRGPVAITLSAQFWEYYGGGVFTCPWNAVVDHAVLLVGYTSNYWIIKNQWGRTWGESGYMRISRSRENDYTNCFIGDKVAYMEPNIYLNTAFGYSLKSFALIILGIMIMLII